MSRCLHWPMMIMNLVSFGLELLLCLIMDAAAEKACAIFAVIYDECRDEEGE